MATSTNAPAPRIDLFAGWPHPTLLPDKKLKAAADAVLSDASTVRSVLGYGPEAGFPSLRVEIGEWLTSFYRPANDIGSERICVTGGASQSLACILQNFTDPVYTRNVWMVSPTYFLACRIFDDAGFSGKLRAIPEDVEGVDVSVLEGCMEDSEQAAMASNNLMPKLKSHRPWRKIYKHVIYAVPTFANPSGRVISLHRRQALIRIARKYDALVITDDVYDMLQWPSSTGSGSNHLAIQPRLVDIDRFLDGGPIDAFGNAISNGSFSKLLAPGCRTGWVEGTESTAFALSQTGSSRSGGCPSAVMAACISRMLDSGSLQEHIAETLKPTYARRYRKMVAAIGSNLTPLGVTYNQSNQTTAGGYFIWLTLPHPLMADNIAKCAHRDQNLSVPEGTLFEVQGADANGNHLNRNIRLCFTWEDEDLLEPGIKRLAQVICQMLAE